MSKHVEVYRRSGNTLVNVGLASNNIYTSEEMTVGTWIDERDIYRTVIVPTELTEVTDMSDPYHYIYRTNVTIPHVHQILNATFLGIDVANKVRFSAPCYVYIKDDYVCFSSPNAITIESGKFKLIIEYTKLGLTDKPYSSGGGRFHLQFYGPAEGSVYYDELTIDYHKAISNMPSNVDYELTDVLNGVNNFDFAADEIQGMIAYVESNRSPTENEDLLYSCVGNSFSHSRNSEYNTWRYALSTDFLNSNDDSIDDTDLWNAIDFDNTAISTPGQEVVYKLNYVSPSTYGGSEADAYLDGAVESDPEFYFKIKNIDGQYKFYLHRKAVEKDTELQENLSENDNDDNVIFNNRVRIRVLDQPYGSGSYIEDDIIDYTATDITLHQENGYELVDVTKNAHNFSFSKRTLSGIIIELITSTPNGDDSYHVDYYACICNEVKNCSESPYSCVSAVWNEVHNEDGFDNTFENHPLWNSIWYSSVNSPLNNINGEITYNLNYHKSGTSNNSTLDDYRGGYLVTPQYSLTIKNIGDGQYSFTLNG